MASERNELSEHFGGHTSKWDASLASTKNAFEDESDEQDEEIKQVEEKAKKHTNRIRMGRALVTLFLIGTAILVSSLAYYFLRDQETTNFENAFGQFSRTVGDAAEEEMLRMREAVRSFGQVLESSAKDTDQIWPFYDYPYIERFAQEQLDSKGLENIQYLTRVTHDQRQAWLDFEGEIYERWVQSGHMRAYGNLDVLAQVGYQDDILAVTDAGVLPSENKTEYWPLAFRWPPPNSYFVVGLDISSINYDDLFASLMKMKNQTVVSNVNPYVESDEHEAEYHAQFHSTLANGKSRTEYPHSFMFHPVHAENENYESAIVSVVLAPIAWDAALRNLLPDNVDGIIVVGHNNCDQSFTYEIVGKDAFFLGNDDLHDSQYNDKEYVVDLDFSDHPLYHSTPGHCSYSLSIYPSSTFEDAYTSDTPLVFVIVVGCTFLVMILIFFLYDSFVERRNRRMVLDSARSNTIVANMFPGALREKVFLDQKKRDFHRRQVKGNAKKSLYDEEEHGDERLDNYEDSVLAELYPDCSVIFADIVGFTAWSATRDPFQVFKLLETLYNSFDLVAKKCGIFKVETVGDCYVAVSGFPTAQKDHAVRMCRFASEILRRFKIEIRELEKTLGPDTGSLGLRIGIHSGEVTAGVLRGERARVQLFGGTMNTASRMESTSACGWIQVSSETAELLERAGLSVWLTPRQDKVIAKGLGEVDTYWVSIPSRGSPPRLDGTHSTRETPSLSLPTTEDDESEKSGDLEETQQRLAKRYPMLRTEDGRLSI